MKFIKRLFKIGEAEANAALNAIEDPINQNKASEICTMI